MLACMAWRKLDGGGPASACVASACALPFPDQAFDAVICSEVLEHVPDHRAAARELARVLKPRGTAVVSVPAYFPERVCWSLSKSYRAMAGGHVRIYRERALKALLEEAGFHIADRDKVHALHSPLWWLKSLGAQSKVAKHCAGIYGGLVERGIRNKSRAARKLERCLDPVLAKSVVFYLRKESGVRSQESESRS
jgi:SAM-dependent methyltransferase